MSTILLTNNCIINQWYLLTTTRKYLSLIFIKKNHIKSHEKVIATLFLKVFIFQNMKLFIIVIIWEYSSITLLYTTRIVWSIKYHVGDKVWKNICRYHTINLFSLV